MTPTTGDTINLKVASGQIVTATYLRPVRRNANTTTPDRTWVRLEDGTEYMADNRHIIG